MTSLIKSAYLVKVNNIMAYAIAALQIILLSLFLLSNTPFLEEIIKPYIKFPLILLGLLLPIFITINYKRTDKKFLFLSLIFLCFYFISTINSPNLNLRSNLIEFLLGSIALLSTLAISTFPSKISKTSLMFLLRISIVIITTISLFGLIYAIIIGGGWTTDPSDPKYQMILGYYNGRLTGIYQHASMVNAALGALLGLSYLSLKVRGKTEYIREYIISLPGLLLILSIIINFLHALLQISWGVLIAIIVAFFIVALASKKCIEKLISEHIKESIIIVFISIILTIFLFLSIGFINLKRGDNPSGRGLDNGRIQLIQEGIKDFTQKPWLGWGSRPPKGKVLITDKKEKVIHYHNSIIQSLVSVGILGSLLFLLILFHIAKYLYYGYGKNGSSVQYYTYALAPTIILLFVYSLFATPILFVLMAPGYTFWLLSGYVMNFYNSKNKKFIKGLT